MKLGKARIISIKAYLWIVFGLITSTGLVAQEVKTKLTSAFTQFQTDSQLKHALVSFYVIDATSGEVVFEKNSRIGMAPASTQKIITSVTAFELLGRNYRYKTDLGYTGMMHGDTLKGDLILRGTGDPSLGSWRYAATKDSLLLKQWINVIKKAGIRTLKGSLNYDNSKFSVQSIPDGWIWQDIGNYYGAAPKAVNWRENQVDVVLRSGELIGSPVEVLSPAWHFINELKAAAKGTGDNAYVYLSNGNHMLIAGTIPVGERAFKIAAANPFATRELMEELTAGLRSSGVNTQSFEVAKSLEGLRIADNKFKLLGTYQSPPLDSIVYWFNRKSINLYGEALVRSLALEKQGMGRTDSGVTILKKFWKEKGLEEEELNVYDGSGLSPLNRVSTYAQVYILKYARTKEWFPYFYNSLPEFNNMKMKSGTISDVKGFCGYHKSRDGKEYIFSFLVNNYSGRSSVLVNKMYKVLDGLK